eukprot:5080548-Karenia_brevis.AAC.1
MVGSKGVGELGSTDNFVLSDNAVQGTQGDTSTTDERFSAVAAKFEQQRARNSAKLKFAYPVGGE